jgi:prepilin-type N-terminal cleavage/methylation domain-containing protein
MFKTRINGFTIVELLVVIVVIGILAAITIVAFNGVQSKARLATLQSDLSGVYSQLTNDQTITGSFPATLALANSGQGVKSSPGDSYQYTVNTSANPQTFCVTATIGTVSYYVSSAKNTPTSGGCPGDGVGGVAAITNLASNPSAESVTSDWGYWTAGGVATFTRATSGGYSGNGFMRMVFTTAPTTGSGGLYYGDVSEVVQVGTTYSYSGYVRTSVGKQMGACIEWYSSTPTLMSYSCGANVTTVANVWTRLSATGAAPAGTAWARITLYANGYAWNVGEVLDADAIMFTQSSTLYNYADGSSPNWIWNGTVNASTSTGSPL